MTLFDELLKGFPRMDAWVDEASETPKFSFVVMEGEFAGLAVRYIVKADADFEETGQITASIDAMSVTQELNESLEEDMDKAQRMQDLVGEFINRHLQLIVSELERMVTEKG